MHENCSTPPRDVAGSLSKGFFRFLLFLSALGILSTPCLAGHYNKKTQSGGHISYNGSNIGYTNYGGGWGGATSGWDMARPLALPA